MDMQELKGILVSVAIICVAIGATAGAMWLGLALLGFPGLFLAVFACGLLAAAGAGAIHLLERRK
ncbi:MAG TPA: hypothetical protein VIO94_15825 [Phenylobacterium sp.]